MSANDILRRAHYLALLLVLGYAVLLALLTIPAIQRELLFLHHVPIPLFPDYANPERYSLAPFKTRNLWLNTSDGEAIGAWHVLPRSVYGALQPFPPRSELDDNLFDEAFSQRPTIIYFHGNAGNRATSHRVRSYSAFSTNLDCNVLAIDYRGFGDSSGTPSEEGLLTDARAAYDYVAQRVARSSHTIRTKQKDTDIATAGEVKLEGEEGGTGRDGAEKNIVLVGQSLGTGVVSGLAGRLAQEGIYPRSLVLIAPFTSITELLTSYRLFRFIPILGPLGHVPFVQRFFQSFLYHTFDSKAALANTFSPTLLLHAINDHTIPHSHSDDLFNSLTLPTTADTNGPAASASTMEAVSYEGWGTVRTVDRGQKGQVIWWEGKNGGHDNLGWAEGTLDLIARIANL
ncbi:hypothetical protein I317_00545 [Kwoniella heveanensis CBS 569]|nr:hypothetical protein I317_00545 [Kwoniella heveanensis CBS 569]